MAIGSTTAPNMAPHRDTAQHQTAMASDIEKDKEIEDAPPSSSPTTSQSIINEDLTDLPTSKEEGVMRENDAQPAQVQDGAQQPPQRSKLKIALIMFSLGISVLLVALVSPASYESL